MELFDIMSYETTKITAFAVPNTYNATDCTVTVTDAPAGTYFLGYAFEVHFGTKAKPINWQVTGTFANATTDFSFDSDANEIANEKNKMYGFPQVWAGGDLTMGIRFKDQESSGDITVDFADVVIMRVN